MPQGYPSRVWVRRNRAGLLLTSVYSPMDEADVISCGIELVRPHQASEGKGSLASHVGSMGCGLNSSTMFI